MTRTRAAGCVAYQASKDSSARLYPGRSFCVNAFAPERLGPPADDPYYPIRMRWIILDFRMVDFLTNRLLATLNRDDISWLTPHLEQVDLQRGMILVREHEVFRYTGFPTTAVVSLVRDMRDGRVAEMASFGREAMIGLPLCGAPSASLGRYVVQIPGSMWRIGTRKMEEAIASRPTVQDMISRYMEALLTLTLQYVACNAVHSVEARACRWIVATHDRTGKNDMPLTHEALAEMLGVQRSTVSEVLYALQSRGMIQQGRGRLTICDRSRLEQTACECYGKLRKRYLSLLPLRD